MSNLAERVNRFYYPHSPGSNGLTPKAAGTLAFFPHFELLFVRSESDIQSTCFNTTGENLEFRRGFMEFRLPVPPPRVVRATLTITETRATISTPLPPDVHELSSYSADLAVDTSDYDAPTIDITTFETDPNEPPNLRELRFDVTEAVQQARRKAIGFRIKLQIDPDEPCVDFAGSGFGGLFVQPPVLEVEFRGGPGSTP